MFDKTKGKWRIHRMDDRIPYSPTDPRGPPLCCHIMPNHHTKISGQGWLPLLEKNLAIFMDGYQNLSGGFPHCALEARERVSNLRVSNLRVASPLSVVAPNPQLTKSTPRHPQQALTGDPVHAFCYADDKERWQRIEYSDLTLKTMQRPGVPESKIIQSVEHAAMWNTMVDCFNKGYLLALCSEGIPGTAPAQGASGGGGDGGWEQEKPRGGTAFVSSPLLLTHLWLILPPSRSRRRAGGPRGLRHRRAARGERRAAVLHPQPAGDDAVEGGLE